MGSNALCCPRIARPGTLAVVSWAKGLPGPANRVLSGSVRSAGHSWQELDRVDGVGVVDAVLGGVEVAGEDGPAERAAESLGSWGAVVGMS